MPSATAGSEGGAKSLKLRVFLAIVPVTLVLDWVTKWWAFSAREGTPGPLGELFGGLVPLTLAYNRGAAFGLSVGDDSRWFFIPVTIVALGLIASLYRQAESRDLLRLSALSMIVAGALGNLWDRVRWNRGVVDFLGPVDLGFWDFPIFNVADIAISVGAVFLAISFWQEERRHAAAERAVETTADGRAVAGERVGE
jgi:signal peptidase II